MFLSISLVRDKSQSDKFTKRQHKLISKCYRKSNFSFEHPHLMQSGLSLLISSQEMQRETEKYQKYIHKNVFLVSVYLVNKVLLFAAKMTNGNSVNIMWNYRRHKT